MEEKIKILLFKSIIVFIVFLSLGILSWAYYNYRLAENVVDPQRIISFTAEGKVFAKPDIARLSFYTITQGEKAEDVQLENNLRMQKVVDFVKKQKVNPEDLKTAQYSLTPQYDYHWCRTNDKNYIPCPPKIIGYELTQGIEVKIRHFEKINEIIGGLTTAGANRISDVVFDIDDIEKYKNEARVEALKKIEQRANLLKEKTTLRIGKIVNVSEGGDYYPYRMEKIGAIATPKDSAAPAPIESGMQEITVQLTVSYALR